MCEEGERLGQDYAKKKDKMGQDERDEAYKEVAKHRPWGGRWADNSNKNPGQRQPKKWFMWVVEATDRDTEDLGVRYYFAPNTVYWDGLLEECKEDSDGDRDDGIIDPTDPQEGFIFRFKRKGKGLEDTEYKGFRLVPRKWDIEKGTDWIADTPKFFDVLKFSSYDEMASAMVGEAVAEAPDDVREDLGKEFERGNREARDKDEDSDRPRRKRQDEDDDDNNEPKEEPRRKHREVKEDDEADASDDVKRIRDKVRKRREARGDDND